MHFFGLLAVATAAITTFQQEFKGKLVNYKHLKVDNKNFEDEVVMAWTTKGEFWVSHNQGQDWKLNNQLGNVVRVVTHPYANDRAFVFTNSKAYYTEDHARSFSALRLPGTAAIAGHVFEFNSKNPNYMILHSREEGCNDQIEECAKTAWYTRDGGRSWKKMLDHVAICKFAVDLLKDTGRDLVFCQHYKDQDSELLVSQDYFASSETKFERIVGFALDPPFALVAAYNQEDELIAQVTVDGRTFAPAHLPEDISPNHRMGYTVIDSSTQTLFLDITANHEFGDIYKSNANGTDFTRILPSVNRSPRGFVDFDKLSVEGVALANVVENAEDLIPGETKVLRTLISHSDGAFWDPLAAPEGECEEEEEGCSLHLHGYTERYDPRNTPDSKAAVGLIIATGNTGESLLPLRDANTYLSSDAGVTWRQIASEPKLWEFGDSGAIIVTVRYGDVTDTLEYSTDEGQTWQEYKFSEEMVQVLNIANIPSDTSRKFVVFARAPLNKGGDKTLGITVQFDVPRKCTFDDFYEWTPAHPRLGAEECLFGHKLQYLRREAGADCSIGKRPPIGKETLGTPSARVENCKCSVRDFECDYNHERAEDGSCKLIPGKAVPDQAAQCANGGISWREITGYRKIAIDTCEGGEDLAPKQFFPCPGMEREFDELFGAGPPPKGSSLGTIFFFLVFIGGAVGYFGLTKTGRSRISLDEDPNEGVLARLARAAGAAAGAAGGQAKELADRLLGSVEDRFASRRGVYSRLDDTERVRILDEHLSDDELDNQELDDFNLYED